MNIDVKKVYRFFFCGYNQLLEKHLIQKIPTTIGVGGLYFEGLYVADYDKNFITMSDKDGIIVTYNRSNIESFAEVLYKKEDGGDSDGN